MTREEAIQELLCLCDEMPSMECRGWKMALDMAIKALEQESFINKPCVSESVCKYHTEKVLDKIRAEIKRLPTTKCAETRRIYIDTDDFKKNVIAVLDNYKAEGEDKR